MKGPLDELAVKEGCWYSQKRADRVVRFFNEFLCHSKGEWAGKNFKLLEWQEWDIIRPLFGWIRKDGTRRFRRAYIEVPKKNGKSTISSGLALYMMRADGEPGAEVYSAAADREQASIVYNEAANMVESSPSLSRMLYVARSRKTITDPLTKSVFRALSADVGTKEGLNIHCLIFDELHAQKTRHLWDALKYGGASRRQPLYVSITTAGSNRESICYDQHRYARSVLEGSVQDTSFYGYIASAEEDDDWTDPKVWKKANPSFGITLKADDFKADFMEAESNTSSQNSFRRYRLNQWTQQDVRWLDIDAWRKCSSKVPTLVPKKSQFFGGLDLSSTTDLTAYVQLFYENGFYFKAHFFMPKDNVEKRVKRDHVPYDEWIRQGWITATPGNVVDQDYVVNAVLKSAGEHKCREIAFDRWNATHVVTRCMEEGLTMVPCGQGYGSMNTPSKDLEKLVIKQALLHGGNPVLAWMANHVAVETNSAGDIKPSKKPGYSRDRIDGIVAMVMALSRYIVHQKPKPSVYETRGVVTLKK